MLRKQIMQFRKKKKKKKKKKKSKQIMQDYGPFNLTYFIYPHFIKKYVYSPNDNLRDCSPITGF
jgi:hypothetical protein